MDHSQIIERVREAFRASMDEDKEVASLYDRVAKGAATYADADRFASIAGRKMGSILASELVDQEIAGELTLDMLRDVLPKTLWTDYDAVSKLTQQMQQALNEAAGLRMKAVPPVYDRQRVYGMAQEVARQHEEESFAEHVTAFVEQVENLSMHTVDSSVEENARAQYDAGLQPKIRRMQTGRCCELCQDLLGVYDYEKVKRGNKEVFWRHTSCRCQVLFQPGDGRVQNAHSKKWYPEEEVIQIHSRRSRELSLEQIRAGRAGLNEHRKKLLERVPETGDWIPLRKDAVEVKDLAYLSAATGHEFAIWEGKNDKILSHGDSRTCDPPEELKNRIMNGHYKLKAHSHVDGGPLIASQQDRETLRTLHQTSSILVGIDGIMTSFTQDPFDIE